VKFIPQSLQALVRIRDHPLRIVIVTNQSAVGRGLLTLQDADAINARLVKTIQDAGGRIDGVFICPHSPEQNCACRKPRPGLLIEAAENLGLDLSRSILIGDALSDIQAGQAAGIPTNVLVLTGRGAEQRSLPDADRLPGFQVFPDLSSALDALLP
jgi:D-glycero-D-manno-heptose 1,7-bisphosphate phosphatase